MEMAGIQFLFSILKKYTESKLIKFDFFMSYSNSNEMGSNQRGIEKRVAQHHHQHQQQRQQHQQTGNRKAESSNGF